LSPGGNELAFRSLSPAALARPEREPPGFKASSQWHNRAALIPRKIPTGGTKEGG
jgi:hypothetical protein